MTFSQNTFVTIGAGGMGLAIARRLGSGQRVVLADFSQSNLDVAARALIDDGHDVQAHLVDVANFDSVVDLAKVATATGRLAAVVNTAGIAAAQGTARRVYEVDLLGTANVIDAFLEVMPSGSSLTSISSIASYLMPEAVSPGLEQHLATAPRDQLLNHADIDIQGSPRVAYAVSKRANIVRVQSAAVRQGKEKGVRLNTVSPGFIATPMLRKELGTDAGGAIKAMIVDSPVPRAGTVSDVANVVAFLTSVEAAFINGVDIIVDGGLVSGQRWGPSSSS
ncbi:hypothetical protein BHE90_003689 [Fusarium euwallaceae]|uniref:Uncharacterized protein n=2 Tax=Fusarium solani species complex TaxID=232080 RepID=A0A3M2SNM3_9HYPO|nr:hypothetical protein CDV36_001146 [Fusarium kuroshium]RTE81826.1 hypothetical protein BHE90_003689 [Fusarium euwallaceae]